MGHESWVTMSLRPAGQRSAELSAAVVPVSPCSSVPTTRAPGFIRNWERPLNLTRQAGQATWCTRAPSFEDFWSEKKATLIGILLDFPTELRPDRTGSFQDTHEVSMVQTKAPAEEPTATWLRCDDGLITRTKRHGFHGLGVKCRNLEVQRRAG